MTRDQGQVLPELSRREAFSAIGMGIISVSGGIGVLKPDLFVGEPRATGDSVSVEQTITTESIEYRAATDTVRYPKYLSGDTPVEYRTEPFEQWASRKCASVGSEVLLPTIHDRFDKEVSGVGKGVSSEANGLVIKALIWESENPDRNETSGSTVSNSELIETAPKTIRTIIRLDDREFMRPVPVYVEEVSTNAA